MSNNQQNTRKVRSIKETTVEIEPTMIEYRIFNSDLEKYLDDYLRVAKKLNINNVAVRMVKGDRGPELGIYVFVDSRSDLVNRQTFSGVADHIREELDMSGTRLSQQLTDALRPFVGEQETGVDRNLVWTKLDPFRVLASYLGVERGVTRVSIRNIELIKKGPQSVTTVWKMYLPERSDSNKGSDNSVFDQIINRNETRRR